MKGFVNIFKPKNMSSSFAVVKVRKTLSLATNEKQKAGHFGTLDPLASGVLPIAIGNATRLFDFAQDKIKVYQATFKFGIETDTLDSEGSIVATDIKHISKKDVLNALDSFVGKIKQIPPKYSAKSVGGKRAYELAREGKQVELKAKEIEIFDFKILEPINGKIVLSDGEHLLGENEFAFEIACSSGTYIRALARDLAQKLGTVGYMSSLLRIKSGEFELSNAVSLEEFEKNPLEYVLPMDFVLGKYKIFDLPQELEKQVLNGIVLRFDNLPEGEFVVKLEGNIIGIAKNVDEKLKFITRL